MVQCSGSALSWRVSGAKPFLSSGQGQTHVRVGASAVHLLLTLIDRVEVPQQQTLEFDMTLRGSTATPALVGTPLKSLR